MCTADNELYDVQNVIEYQIYKVAQNSPLEHSDLMQIGYLGYLKAQQNYKPEYGKISLKYVSQYIRRELIAAQRKEWAYQNRKTGNIDWVEPDEPEKNVTSNPILKDLEDALERLPKIQGDIIRAYYLDSEPKNLLALAKKYGTSKQRVWQLKNEGLRFLQQLGLEPEDYE